MPTSSAPAPGPTVLARRDDASQRASASDADRARPRAAANPANPAHSAYPAHPQPTNRTPFAIVPDGAHARSPKARPALVPWGDEVKRILCVRLDNLGDVLMTAPALHALRASAPQRHITLLTSPAGAAIAKFLPDVDDVIVYDAPWIDERRSAGERDEAQLLERLRAGRFDAAAIFTVYSQNPLPAAMLCFLAGIERRLAHCRENPYALLTHWVPEREPHIELRHEVERQLALARSVGAHVEDTRMHLQVEATARDSLKEKLLRHGIEDGQRLLVLHPGATAASRRYPPALYAEAVERLAPHATIVLTGSASEAPLTGDIARRVRHAETLPVDLAGALTLGEMIALLDRAVLLVANNSGPVHIAAALQTPVVDLYALTNPQHTPWMTAHRLLYRDVPCRWCYRGECPEGHHACLRGVTPEAVAQAACELLEDAAVPRAAAPV